MNPVEIVALSQNIEKLGIIGVLALVTMLLGYAAFYFRKEVAKCHEQRERETGDLRTKLHQLQMVLIVIKTAADAAGVKYDLRGIGDIDIMLRNHHQ